MNDKMTSENLQAWAETARKITGAKRIESIDYQEPLLKLKLAFNRQPEIIVTEVIDLSAGEEKIHSKIMDMLRQAQSLSQQNKK